MLKDYVILCFLSLFTLIAYGSYNFTREAYWYLPLTLWIIGVIAVPVVYKLIKKL